jgi:hypothetical protein
LISEKWLPIDHFSEITRAGDDAAKLSVGPGYREACH